MLPFLSSHGCRAQAAFMLPEAAGWYLGFFCIRIMRAGGEFLYLDSSVCVQCCFYKSLDMYNY